ncbi:MAG: cysteine desulfurase family protein [Patescibacteria group bacterium]
MKKIYLDYAATTPIDPKVLKAMKPYFSAKFGNPSSLHSFGQEAMAAIDESREKIAKAIGAPPAGGFREIIFTGSATEANNLALRGIVKFFGNPQAIVFQNQNNPAPAAGFSSPSARWPRFAGTKPSAPAGCSSSQYAFGQKISPLRIIVSAIEHESILETCRDLEQDGVEIIYLPVNRQGLIDLKKLKESLNERTVLVSIMYANNEIGTIQNIPKISEIISDFKKEKLKPNTNQLINQLTNYPLFHTDAVQAFQFLDCDVNKLGINLMTLSAHKIYGPKGIGLLYSRIKNGELRMQNLSSIITGGGQEFGLRSGTENVPAIVGFAKAVELAVKNREKESKRIAKLTDYFWKEIIKIKPKAEINGVSSIKHQILNNRVRLPNILSIYFPNENAQDLLMKLDLAGVAISSGSACSTRSTQPSHVLKAIGLNEKRVKNSLRFSFGKFTTKGEINNAIKIIKRIIKKIM